MVSHPTSREARGVQFVDGSAALINCQMLLIYRSPSTMDFSQFGIHDTAVGSHRGPRVIYIGSPTKRQRPLQATNKKPEKSSPRRLGVTHRKPRSRSPSAHQNAFVLEESNDGAGGLHAVRQQHDVTHLTALRRL